MYGQQNFAKYLAKFCSSSYGHQNFAKYLAKLNLPHIEPNPFAK